MRTGVDGPAEPLPPGIDLAAYRIVQEALTNVCKHAPGASAVVGIHYGNATLTVQVDNDVTSGTSTDQQVGHGLIGMRERVSICGGTLHTGVDNDGRFTIRAQLPLRAGAQR